MPGAARSPDVPHAPDTSCIHTHKRMHVGTCKHACMQTRTCAHIYIHTCIHSHTNLQTHMHPHKHTRMQPHTHVHMCMHTYKHAYVPHMPMCTHKHAWMQTHTCAYAPPPPTLAEQSRGMMARPTQHLGAGPVAGAAPLQSQAQLGSPRMDGEGCPRPGRGRFGGVGD